MRPEPGRSTARDAPPDAPAVARILDRISHELRAPLNVIVGHAQLLGLDDVGSRAAQENVEEILRAGTHVELIAGELQTFARILEGDYSCRAAPQRLSLLVREAARGAASVLGACHIHVDPSIDELPVASGDRAQLLAALVRTIVSAEHYARPRGQVWVVRRPDQAGRVGLWISSMPPGRDPPAEPLHSVDELRFRAALDVAVVDLMLRRMDGSVGTEVIAHSWVRYEVSMRQIEANA